MSGLIFMDRDGERSSKVEVIWTELSSEIGTTCLGPTFLWAELSWAELSVILFLESVKMKE